MRTITMLAVAAAAAALGACGCASFKVPEGYVKLSDPGYLYQTEAVSADGVYLGLRKPQSSEDGNLDFWAKAIKNQMTGVRGYIFASEADLQSADGTPGKRMDFTANLGGRELGYAVAVWVLGKRVFVAEAGGPKDKFDADRAKIEAALKTVRLK